MKTFISTPRTTHGLRCATQRRLAPQRRVLPAAVAKPELRVVDGGGTPPELTIPRVGEVRLRVAWAMG